jgi:UPF0716 family protein affecting phage T7 exclusion
MFLGQLDYWSSQIKIMSWVIPAWFLVTSTITGIGLWKNQGLTPWALVAEAEAYTYMNEPAQAMIRSMELLVVGLLLQLPITFYMPA